MELNALYHLTLEFDSEPDLRETTGNLLNVHGVTGELNCRRLADGCWRLEVVAEHQLGEGLVQKLKGRVVAVPGNGAGAGA